MGRDMANSPLKWWGSIMVNVGCEVHGGWFSHVKSCPATITSRWGELPSGVLRRLKSMETLGWYERLQTSSTLGIRSETPIQHLPLHKRVTSN